jgi:replication factor A1
MNSHFSAFPRPGGAAYPHNSNPAQPPSTTIGRGGYGTPSPSSYGAPSYPQRGGGMPGAGAGGGMTSFPQRSPATTFPAQRAPQITTPFSSSFSSSPSTPVDVNNPPLMPIQALSPFRTRWWIKARVLDKSNIRTWNKEGSSGQLFTMTLVDAEGSAIRATVFQEGVNKFNDMMENGKVYIFTKGTVKQANKKFSNLPNDYELSFDQHAEITAVGDDDAIVRSKLSPIAISQLLGKEKNSLVDLCVVVLNVGSTSSIIAKSNNQPMMKRVINVGDHTNHSVDLTLWQQDAETFNIPV